MPGQRDGDRNDRPSIPILDQLLTKGIGPLLTGRSATPPVPFDRCYWVKPRLFLVGPYPGAADPKEARARIDMLVTAGIRCVLSLMEPPEVDQEGRPFEPYIPLLEASAAAHGVRIECLNMPIRDFGAPTRAFMSSILDVIDARIMVPNPKPMFVHCWGGLGRTGTVVGCWVARHGTASGKSALEMIQHLRRRDAGSSLDSPQTRLQRALVRSWHRGE